MTRTTGRNSELVLKVLQNAEKPISAYEILDALRPAGIKAPLQVYRALEQLIKGHKAHKLESLNAFVACHNHKCHKYPVTAFTICRMCQAVSEVGAKAGEDAVSQMADKNAFLVENGVIEMHGLCDRCR